MRITDADGQLLAQGSAEVGPVALVPIKVPKVGIVGTTRLHKARLVW